jgi:hypothetical protein
MRRLALDPATVEVFDSIPPGGNIHHMLNFLGEDHGDAQRSPAQHR